MAATFAKPYSTKISGFFLIWSPGMQFSAVIRCSVWTQFVCGGRSPCKLVAFTKIWVQILSNYDGNLTYHKMLLPFSFGRQSEVLRLLHSQLIWKENVLPARSLDSTVSSFVLLLSTTWSRETSHQLFDSYILAWNSSTWSSQATRCFAYLGSQMESSTISVDLVATCKTEAHHRSKCIICSIINDVDGMNPPILKCTNVLIGSQCATSYYCYGDLYQKQSNLRPFFPETTWGISWSRYSWAYNGLSDQGIQWVYTFLEQRIIVRQDAYKVIRRKDYRIDSSHKKNLERHSQ